MKDNSFAIIGTHGIPAKYGGFETLTEHLTKDLGDKIIDMPEFGVAEGQRRMKFNTQVVKDE